MPVSNDDRIIQSCYSCSDIVIAVAQGTANIEPIYIARCAIVKYPCKRPISARFKKGWIEFFNIVQCVNATNNIRNAISYVCNNVCVRRLHLVVTECVTIISWCACVVSDEVGVIISALRLKGEGDTGSIVISAVSNRICAVANKGINGVICDGVCHPIVER